MDQQINQHLLWALTMVSLLPAVELAPIATVNWRSDPRYMHTWESEGFSLGLPSGSQCDPVTVLGPGRFVCSVGSFRNMCLQECQLGYHAVDLPDIVYLCKTDGYWWNLHGEKIATPTPRCVKDDEVLEFPR